MVKKFVCGISKIISTSPIFTKQHNLLFPVPPCATNAFSVSVEVLALFTRAFIESSIRSE
jgi:hypothetical protein